MNLEITEEERAFLERVCDRAELFSIMKSSNDTDIKKIRALKIKLRILNPNLFSFN